MIPGRSAADIEQEHWARYRFAAKFVTGKRVADIACGSGYGSKFLKDAGATEVVGVDLDEEAIAFAKQHYVCEGVSFMAGSAESLTMLAEGSFDVVVSYETIEHLNDVGAYLREIRRVLKPGGTFLVSTPERRLASVLYPILGRPQNRFHVREFTKREFLALLDEHFAVRDCLGQVPIARSLAFWPVQFGIKSLAKVLRRIGGERMKTAFYGDASGYEVATPPAGTLPKYWVACCEKV
jgi:O-antigen biosynthesis protein